MIFWILFGLAVPVVMFWMFIKFLDWVFADKPIQMTDMGPCITIGDIMLTKLDSKHYIDPSNSYVYGKGTNGYDYFWMYPSNIIITRDEFFAGIQTKKVKPRYRFDSLTNTWELI